jgi:hypothetical protein
MSMRWALILVILLSGRAAQAQLERVLPKVDFTATSVQQVGGAQLRQTIHYADEKLRIDGPEGFATTIMDLRTGTQILLMADHTYLVLPLDDELYRRFFPFRYAKKLKQEQIDGLATTKYVFDADGGLNAGGYYWLTSNGIMVRSAYEDGVYGADIHHVSFLTDLKVAPVPASLFGIPEGYRQVR